jgi:uncharacterized metal-binding protein YceD (DUF177 family)
MKVEQALRINVTHVPQEGRDYDFALEPDWLEDKLADCGVLAPFHQGRLGVRVSPLGQNYYVKGRLTLPVRLTCVRCLKEVAVTLDLPFTIVMLREGSAGNLLPRGKKGDVGLATFKGDEFALDDEVRENIVVELPMNPTCPEGCSIQDLYEE